MGAIIFSGDRNGKQLSKFDASVYELYVKSKMELTVRLKDEQPNYVRLKVTGPAARIPSTTNSRLNMFPKIGIVSILKNIRNDGTAATRAGQAMALLKKTQVVSTINPEHRIRLDALTMLYESLERKPKKPIPCDTDNRWLVTIHLHQDLHRVDTHNLTKPVCDWLQRIGLIANDKHVDCFPIRNQDFAVEEQSSLYICMRRLEDVRNEVSALTAKMTQV